MINKINLAKINVILSMFIYGTVGVFVRYIPLPSAVISMFRGVIGASFLLVVLLIKRSKISWRAIKENFVRLFLLGAMLGVNWIFLFEAYKYTSVAMATLCYYLAPIFIVAISPFVFKEKMTVKKTSCIVVALIGMVFVSGVVKNGITNISEIKGIIFGICAALFYATIVINNKKMHNISAYDRTIAQLIISSVVLLPYNLFADNLNDLSFDYTAILLIIVLGVVHTGLSYFLYFGSMEKLPAQTLATFSYIDPVVAVLLSACALKESIDVLCIIGAILILGSAMISEYTPKKNIKKE